MVVVVEAVPFNYSTFYFFPLTIMFELWNNKVICFSWLKRVPKNPYFLPLLVLGAVLMNSALYHYCHSANYILPFPNLYAEFLCTCKLQLSLHMYMGQAVTIGKMRRNAILKPHLAAALFPFWPLSLAMVLSKVVRSRSYLGIR